jgi:nitrate reductase assembly molybdenum cofactor insertion protein NarJ
MRTRISSQERLATSLAYALLARSLSRDVVALHDHQHIGALREALTEAGSLGAVAALDPIDVSQLPPAAGLAGRWVRWFDLGRIAPYEGSNVVLSAGGVTGRLADVAGYYRAFGMQIRGDRPDHVVAELEFLAFALAVEADAVEAGDDDHAAVAADAIRSFLRDHIGTWIDAWAARVAEVVDTSPWAPYAAAAAELVRVEGGRRNVIAARTAAVLVADAGAIDEEPELTCE